MDSLFLWGSLEEQAPEQGSELPTTVKSEEELAKFTVDEHLSDTERTVLFLNGGQVIQQRHAIANLPAVIKARGRQGWESVAGPLKQALNRLDTECQIEAAEVFAYIARERLMPPADLQACLLPTIVRNINKEKSEEETEAWLRALTDLVPMLDKESVRGEVVPLALSKGDMEDSAQSRVLCARILGAVSLFMTKEEVEGSFFRRALKMCQDVDHTVRLSSCQQLAAIGRAVGRDAATRTVLDELQELLKDEDLQVRAAAFTSLIQLLDLIPADVRRARVLPILRDHATPFDLDASMLRCVAKHFGQMLAVVKGELEQDDQQLFYGCYRHLACKPDVELRRSCAQQVGQVVKAAVSIQPTAYMQYFSETFQAFATDYDEEVRLAAASALHEVARFSGKDYCCQLLTRPLVQLLRDDSSRVQAAVVHHLAATLPQFVADCSKGKQAALDEVVRALLDLEAGSARNWRLQVGLASCFPTFHQFFTSDQVYEHFLPMAFRLLTSSAAAARPVVAEGIACFLRYNKKEKQRAELFLQLIREYARGRCYAQRLAFAEVCKHMVQRFSAKFVKEWVFDLCLELLYDPVPNVRLQITYILPTLKRAVRLPEDVDLLERLNNAISNSMTDNDRDVSQTARMINDTYKRMPVRMGGASGLTLVDASGGAQAAFEAEDRKKEAEEADCTFAPEDVKEIKAEIVQMSYKKKPGAGGDPPGKSAINRRTDAIKAGAAVSVRSSPSGPLGSGGAAAGTKAPAGTGVAAVRAIGAASSVSTSAAAGRAGALTAAQPSTSLAGKLAPAGAGAAAASAAGAARKVDTATKAVTGSAGLGPASKAGIPSGAKPGGPAAASAGGIKAVPGAGGHAATRAAPSGSAGGGLSRISGGAPKPTPVASTAAAAPVRKGSR